MSTTDIRVYGASDDLIETRGAVDEEYGANWGLPTIVTVQAYTGTGTAEVRLRVEHEDSGDGIWTVTEETSTGLVTIVPARGEDEGNDADGCPGYSQKAIVRGGFAVEVEGGSDA